MQDSNTKMFGVIPKVGEESWLSYILLAFISSAGFFYVPALPALVSAMIDGFGFSEEQAGIVASVNAYGSMTGALISVFLLKRLPWKQTMSILFVAMIALELLSSTTSTPEAMMAIRFILGALGGCSIGIGLAIIARLNTPDRGYGFLLVIQTGLGGAIIFLRLMLAPVLGSAAVFVMLAVLVAISLMIIAFLGDYKPKKTALASADTGFQWPPINKLTILTLLAIFLYQAMANGMWVYMERIGLAAGHTHEFVSSFTAYGAWIGAVGGLVPVILGLRYGRFIPIISGIILMFLTIYAALNAENSMMYFAANALLTFGWSYIIAYLFGLAAELDGSGHLMTLGGTASKFGIATGPLIAAKVVAGGSYSDVLMIVAVGFALCGAAAALPALTSDRALKAARQKA